jgi:hypothetical protein
MPTLRKIATSSVTGTTTTTVDFTAIPQNFKHLLIYSNIRSTRSSGGTIAEMYFNNRADGALLYEGRANYANYYVTFTSTAGGANSNAVDTLYPFGTTGQFVKSTPTFGMTEMKLLNYSSASANDKCYLMTGGDMTSSESAQGYSNFNGYRAGRFTASTPITRITFFAGTSLYFVEGCEFDIYGYEG